jgi:transcriptional regulator with XRE-family HTH domain
VKQRVTPLGEMLTLYRAVHRLTVRELAPVIGISYPTLSRIERGGVCDVPTLLKLFAWLSAVD